MYETLVKKAVVFSDLAHIFNSVWNIKIEKEVKAK